MRAIVSLWERRVCTGATIGFGSRLSKRVPLNPPSDPLSPGVTTFLSLSAAGIVVCPQPVFLAIIMNAVSAPRSTGIEISYPAILLFKRKKTLLALKKPVLLITDHELAFTDLDG